ncbi:type II toxin-antitoxin system Phd/YefM family antitoxin [Brevibacterium litoralis]|uniref:type II toxin-antitoxin system Phd/YefM family antitoxin n=1 Tax=Brevibacterium litoralis TaxID=3138935 RepID=UPI0032EECD7E
MMISAREARSHLFALIEKVTDERVTIEIESTAGNVVLMPADEYAAWQEAAHLFRSPANARRLLGSYDRARSGEFEECELDRRI